MKKGLTLIEVILAITLISIIAISFLPGITFAYKNLIDSRKYTVDIFNSQKEIEKLMEEKRKEDPVGTDIEKTIFGIKVQGHNIKTDVGEHGEINVFQPKKEYFYEEPRIIKDINSGLSSTVRLSVFNKNTEILPVPKILDMYKSNGQLNLDINFLVDKKYYKIENTKIHLVNVYRWYISSMVEYTDDALMDNYFIIKEWNAARPLVSYQESKVNKFIPNIQNNPDYNRLTFKEIQDGLDLTDADLIRIYGNRYFYFSITPFAISGKIGNEEFSNAIYVKAPKIEIDKAFYGPSDNQVSITFKDNIKENVNMTYIDTNKQLGHLIGAYRDLLNPKLLILEFDNSLNQNIDIDTNFINYGAVESIDFGDIYIWNNNKPNGEFTINKK